MPFFTRRADRGSSPPPLPADLKAPNALLMLLEGRAPWEFAATLAATPWLRRLPRGDGHPVLVFPGLAANDLTTATLRRFLHDRGYVPYPWQLGFNFGPRAGVLRQCRERADEIVQRHGQSLSLVGWSLGGIYAREIAKELPAATRCVITLGTPFTGHARATNAWRLYEMVSGQVGHDPQVMAQISTPPPVPTTSVYSRSDGIVAWRCSLNDDAPLAENIEILASHVGMGMNPLALAVVADRLAQPPGAWRPFEAAGAARWFMRRHAAGLAAA